jgi:Sulfotransferase family
VQELGSRLIPRRTLSWVGSRARISRRYPVCVGDSFESLLLVAGSARSGTTWLQEMLGAQARFRVIFEPFHEQLAPARLRSIPAYIPPSLTAAPYISDVEKVLRGKVRDKWIDQHNHHLISRRRLVKEIHSNLRLGWFRERFPYFPIVYLIRHPLAVAVSRGRLGWRPSPEKYFSDPLLVADHLQPFQSVLAACTSDLDRRVTQWCIENYVPLSYFQQRNDICIVFYERLVADLDRELRTIVEAIGLRMRHESRKLASTPSVTAYRAQGFQMASALDDWRRQLSVTEVARALGVVSAFGLDALYGIDPMPRDVDPLAIFRRASETEATRSPSKAHSPSDERTR